LKFIISDIETCGRNLTKHRH